MKAMTLSLIFCMVMLAAADLVFGDRPDRITLPGELTNDKNICICPRQAKTCVCVIELEPPVTPMPFPGEGGIVVSRPYRRLISLESFEEEDENFLYFRAGIRENTQPPVFDVTVRGNVLVRVSKRELEEFVMGQ